MVNDPSSELLICSWIFFFKGHEYSKFWHLRSQGNYLYVATVIYWRTCNFVTHKGSILIILKHVLVVWLKISVCLLVHKTSLTRQVYFRYRQTGLSRCIQCTLTTTRSSEQGFKRLWVCQSFDGFPFEAIYLDIDNTSILLRLLHKKISKILETLSEYLNNYSIISHNEDRSCQGLMDVPTVIVS